MKLLRSKLPEAVLSVLDAITIAQEIPDKRRVIDLLEHEKHNVEVLLPIAQRDEDVSKMLDYRKRLNNAAHAINEYFE